jgi:hypothetical protein
MKKKRTKKTVLLTPEERAGYLERLESLWRSYERIQIELETGKRPPPDFKPTSQ